MERLLWRLLLLLEVEEDEDGVLSDELLVSEARGRFADDVEIVDWWMAVAHEADEHVSSHDRIRMPSPETGNTSMYVFRL